MKTLIRLELWKEEVRKRLNEMGLREELRQDRRLKPLLNGVVQENVWANLKEESKRKSLRGKETEMVWEKD